MPAQGAVFEGKSKEEAVSRGLKELRLDRSDVYIEVVEEGASGFLGFGSRPYRVRLIPRARRSERPSGERPSSGRRPRERPVGRGGREPDRGRGERGGPVARRAGRPGADAGPRERERPDQGGGRQRRGRREDRRRSAVGPPRSEPYPRRPPAAEAAARREPLERAPRSDRPEMLEAPTTPPDAAIVERARQLASELFEQMGFEARVAASAGEDRVSVAVEVDQDEELLTGRKGEVRQALQHLLNRMLNRAEHTRYHLHLEINDFWVRREQELSELAKSMAEEAVETQGEVLSEYLNAQERRVIHLTLRDDHRVKTYALGEGLIKKVAVSPADHPGAPQQE